MTGWIASFLEVVYVNPVHPIDTPPGWQAVADRLSQHIGRCEALLNRNAYFSARSEAESAILYLVRVLDLMDNRYASEPAWLAAQQALREADDFVGQQRLSTDRSLLRRIVDSHETPILKNGDLSTVAPMAAAQHYHIYALDLMLQATQRHPWACEALYALGRTYQAQAETEQGAKAEPFRSRAAVYYRGAHNIDPNNPLASNQLGYLMLQMDRPADAQQALIASIQAEPSAANLQNLAEASRRLGDRKLQNWAETNLAAIPSVPVPTHQIPVVMELDPKVFAAISPRASGPSTVVNNSVANGQAHAAATSAGYRTAAAPGNGRY